MNTEQKIIKNKIGLLSLAEELGNVSRACKVMGFSRDTFYRYQELVSEGGMERPQILEYIRSIIPIVVQLKRGEKGHRYISEIYYSEAA